MWHLSGLNNMEKTKEKKEFNTKDNLKKVKEDIKLKKKTRKLNLKENKKQEKANNTIEKRKEKFEKSIEDKPKKKKKHSKKKIKHERKQALKEELSKMEKEKSQLDKKIKKISKTLSPEAKKKKEANIDAIKIMSKNPKPDKVNYKEFVASWKATFKKPKDKIKKKHYKHFIKGERHEIGRIGDFFEEFKSGKLRLMDYFESLSPNCPFCPEKITNLEIHLINCKLNPANYFICSQCKVKLHRTYLVNHLKEKHLDIFEVYKTGNLKLTDFYINFALNSSVCSQCEELIFNPELPKHIQEMHNIPEEEIPAK
jgi:chemotaxis protein histidine kinase CheA